jgi:hypothetical protein
MLGMILHSKNRWWLRWSRSGHVDQAEEGRAGRRAANRAERRRRGRRRLGSGHGSPPFKVCLSHEPPRPVLHRIDVDQELQNLGPSPSGLIRFDLGTRATLHALRDRLAPGPRDELRRSAADAAAKHVRRGLAAEPDPTLERDLDAFLARIEDALPLDFPIETESLARCLSRT